MNRDHPNYCIVEISQNAEKGSGEMKTLSVSLTLVRDHQLTLVWKTLIRIIIIIIQTSFKLTVHCRTNTATPKRGIEQLAQMDQNKSSPPVETQRGAGSHGDPRRHRWGAVLLTNWCTGSNRVVQPAERPAQQCENTNCSWCTWNSLQRQEKK